MQEMQFPRRQFLRLGAGAALVTGAAPKAPALKIGVTDWNLKMIATPQALGAARRIGFEGVEVSLGAWKGRAIGSRLPLDNAALQSEYRELAAQHGVAISATCLDVLLSAFPLKSDPLAPNLIRDAISITPKLRSKIIILPFAGKGAWNNLTEMHYVAGALKEAATDAEKGGVILGVEDLVSAEENARLLDRVQSPAVRLYYDVGNSNHAGFDVLSEIRWLGRHRICQFHFKDADRYLGEGRIDFARVLDQIGEIGYSGFADLETPSPSGSVEADLRRNLDYIRGLITP
jgi:L-ribulose-5-phosphate 3-epimerase